MTRIESFPQEQEENEYDREVHHEPRIESGREHWIAQGKFLICDFLFGLASVARAPGRQFGFEREWMRSFGDFGFLPKRHASMDNILIVFARSGENGGHRATVCEELIAESEPWHFKGLSRLWCECDIFGVYQQKVYERSRKSVCPSLRANAAKLRSIGFVKGDFPLWNELRISCIFYRNGKGDARLTCLENIRHSPKWIDLSYEGIHGRNRALMRISDASHGCRCHESQRSECNAECENATK